MSISFLTHRIVLVGFLCVNIVCGTVLAGDNGEFSFATPSTDRQYNS